MSDIRRLTWKCLPDGYDGTEVVCGARYIANFRDHGIAEHVVDGHNLALRKRRPDGDDVGDEQ